MAGPWEKYRSGAQGVPIGMQDPTMPYKAQGAALDNQGKAANIQNDAARIALERQRLELARQAAAKATQASSRANEIADRDKNTRLGNLKAMEQQIARVRELYNKGPGATKGAASLIDFIPRLDRNENFNAASAGLGEIGLSAFRVPGMGSQSDAELRQFIEANRPSASDNDSKIEEKLRTLENRLGQAYGAYGVKYRGGTKAPPRKPKTSGGWKIERLD